MCAVLEDRLQGALLCALCWRTACRGRCYKGCVGGPPVGGAVRGAVLEDCMQGALLLLGEGGDVGGPPAGGAVLEDCPQGTLLWALCWKTACRGRC